MGGSETIDIGSGLAGGKMLLLELGSGDRPFEDGRGWTHSDERVLPDIELVFDAADPPEDLDGRCQEVRATHLLEHFSHRDTFKILRRWRRLLTDGGLLYLEVPNLEQQMRDLMNRARADWETVRLMYGDQDYPGNYHKTGFTSRLLKEYLKESGYRRVEIQDIGLVLNAWAHKP